MTEDPCFHAHLIHSDTNGKVLRAEEAADSAVLFLSEDEEVLLQHLGESPGNQQTLFALVRVAAQPNTACSSAVMVMLQSHQIPRA